MSAFSGLRVVDFTQVIAGPFATYQLASLGAEVIKVEQPGTGDQGRALLVGDARAQEARISALFSAVNAGKRSLSLDLKHPDAGAVVERLVEQADVVVENFKAGTMERLGFGPDRLLAINPRLILCRISGYGQTGPRASAAAYDPVVQAISGMMSVTGYVETGPTKVGFWVVDSTTGMNAAFAISAALFRRAQSGVGEVIDVAMLDTALSLLSPLMSQVMNFGAEPPFTGNGSPGSGGSSQVYPTQDGYITVAAVTNAQFIAMMEEIGRGDMARLPRFATREERTRNSEEIRELVVGALKEDSTRNWVERFTKRGVACGEINRLSEVAEDAQVIHRELFEALPGLE